MLTRLALAVLLTSLPTIARAAAAMARAQADADAAMKNAQLQAAYAMCMASDSAQ